VAASLLVVGLAFLGCVYQPEVPDRVLRCDEHQRCPAGYICNATRTGAVVSLVCCRTIGCEARPGTGPAAPEPDAGLGSLLDSDGPDLARPADSAPPADRPAEAAAAEGPAGRD
jgi:hypothetical protein